jgi:hypothetical protein
VDGKEVHTFTNNIPTEEMSIALQGHVGRADDGWYFSPNDSGVDKVDVSVDWVRVQQHEGPYPSAEDSVSGAPSGSETAGEAGTEEQADGSKPAAPSEDASAADNSASKEDASAADDPAAAEDSSTADNSAPNSSSSDNSGSDTATADNSGDGEKRTSDFNLAVNDGGTGDDWLRGTSDRDLLRGAAGSDDLKGFEGDDRMAGGLDHDGLTLGGGADTVAFSQGDGYDWVVDFNPGTDKLELHGITSEDVSRWQETRWDMAGLVLDFGNGDSMFLQGVSELKDGDIIFYGQG